MQVEAFIYGQMAHLLHATGHVAGNQIAVGSIWEARTQPAWLHSSDTQWHRLARDGQCVATLHSTGNPLPLTARKRARVVSAELCKCICTCTDLPELVPPCSSAVARTCSVLDQGSRRCTTCEPLPLCQAKSLGCAQTHQKVQSTGIPSGNLLCPQYIASAQPPHQPHAICACFMSNARHARIHHIPSAHPPHPTPIAMTSSVPRM
jgi:hypothetical protein